VSERHKTHNGRDLDGHFKVRQADVEELLEDPAGVDFVRDDVRLGGAVADVGPHAGESGERIERLIEENEENVQRASSDRSQAKSRGRSGGKGAKRGNKGQDGMR
jgi:hypothetical protein